MVLASSKTGIKKEKMAIAVSSFHMKTSRIYKWFICIPGLQQTTVVHEAGIALNELNIETNCILVSDMNSHPSFRA